MEEKAGLAARSGDRQREGEMMEKKKRKLEMGGGGGRQYQCAEHMTDALGLLLNGFPVGRTLTSVFKQDKTNGASTPPAR